MSRVLRWSAELAGVTAIAAGAWWRVDPLAGLVVAGVYLVVLANSARSVGGRG